MSHDDVLFGYRLRLFTLAEELGVRPACRAMGVHHSTYYRLKARVDRWGLEALRIRERRRPRSPAADRPPRAVHCHFPLGQPGFAPRRIAPSSPRESGRHPNLRRGAVEPAGLEPATSWMQTTRSSS